MLNSMFSKILVLFIMLSMLGQGLLSDGHWMITQASETEPTTSAMQAQHSGCHDMGANADMDAQDHQQMKSNGNCCNDSGSCTDDCKHCLVIATTASVYQSKSWPGFSPSERSLAITMPHFHSIDLSTDIRPPIA